MSTKIKIAIWFGFLLSVLLVGTLQPPFQTPDEFNHLKRAYLLSQGEIFLNSENGHTGGNIDSGLLEFMSYYNAMPFHYDAKFSDEINEKAGVVNWSRNEVFSQLPNTAVYVHIIYIPQALLIKIAKSLELKIYDSYIFVKFGCIVI
jgi:uncharacterized membrane protein